LFFLGEFVSAHEHLEQAMVLYDPQQHRSHAFLYGGHDPGVCCRSIASMILWQLGYPDQAMQRSHEALTLAQELSHAYSQAHALYWSTDLYQLRREGHHVQESAETVMRLCAEQGFAYFLPRGLILQGWVLVEQGQGEAGLVQIRQGLSAYRTTGAGHDLPKILALLAGAYGKVGQVEEGLSVLVEALDLVDKTGEGYYEAEIHRLKGALLLQLSADNHPEAETYFQKAMTIAQNQSTKSWELRAATSLARLWQCQGKRQEAHDLLAPVYHWFTEGFDTADLKDAKALLDELA
jgi:predicted ATPase